MLLTQQNVKNYDQVVCLAEMFQVLSHSHNPPISALLPFECISLVETFLDSDISALNDLKKLSYKVCKVL